MANYDEDIVSASVDDLLLLTLSDTWVDLEGQNSQTCDETFWIFLNHYSIFL